MKPQYKIEVFRNGEWMHQDSCDDIMDAYMLASSLCHRTDEDRIRITGTQPRWGGWMVLTFTLNLVATILFAVWLYFRWK